MRSRLRAVWRRVFALAWPVMAEQTLRTLMRTVDVVVTAAISPAAVVAVGLADLYARFPLRVGLGFGGGAISLSSQDTGRDATATRDEAITQAVLVGALAGVPFAAFGVLVGPTAIRLLGAAPDVVALGSAYLAVVLLTAPARHVALTAAIASSHTAAGFARPQSTVVTKQLFAVSLPKVAEGGVSALAEFPFNALLLSFGTNVNAAFQIGRRVYQQVTGPLSRGYNVAANVVVGQALGEGDPGTARFDGWAVAALGVLTVGVVGLILSYYARPLVALLANEPETVRHGVQFARAYGLSAPFLAAFVALSGSLQGASETRVPFLARATGMLGFLVGFSWLAGRTLGHGPVAAYWGVALSNVWMAGVVAAGFHYGGWASRAASMMAERSDA